MSDPYTQLNEKQREQLANMVEEGVNSKVRQDAEQDFMKELRKRAKEELGIPTKIFNQVVNVAFKHNGNELDAEKESVLILAEYAGFYRSE